MVSLAIALKVSSSESKRMLSFNNYAILRLDHENRYSNFSGK